MDTGICEIERPGIRELFSYPPVGRTERRRDLYVQGVGYGTWPSETDPVWHPQPFYYRWTTGRVLDCLSLAYVTEGEGELGSELAPRSTVTAGSVFVTFPGLWHRNRAVPGSRWTYCWVHLGGDYARHLLRERLFSPHQPVLYTGIQDALLEPFLHCLQRARAQPSGYRQAMAANMREFVAAVLALATGQSPRRPTHPLIARAQRFLETHVEEPVDLHALAASLGMSYHYFRELFKRHAGIAPYQYHLARRVDRAKLLLAQTDRMIQDIAISLQFDDAYHFSKTFKARTGRCPSDWRRA